MLEIDVEGSGSMIINNQANTGRLPDRLWIFDGHCGFCSASVQLVLKVDMQRHIRFASIQSDVGRQLALSHGIDPDNPSTFLFVDGGHLLTSSDAVLALARHLPWPWRGLLVLRALPRSWRDGAYVWLARNRYHGPA
jgi:predicted DCC family thiol-disulfide oxidoreductase YuxK